MTNIPSVSLIIPVYNGDIQFLKNALTLFFKNEGDLITEVIVVDDGSDNDKKISQEEMIKISNKIRVIYQKNGGPSSARNKGIQESKGDIVAFMDSDCIPEKGWLENLLIPILYSGKQGVGGTVLTYVENNAISKFADFQNLLRKPKKNSAGEIVNIITANCAFQKNILLIIGGFDISLKGAEDLDLTYRIAQISKSDIFGYSEKSIVYHKHRSNLLQFIKQQYGYGYGAMYHCLLRNRDQKEVGIIPINTIDILIYLLKHLYFSFRSAFIKKKSQYNWYYRFVLFPFLEYIRRISILCGWISSYVSHNPQ